MTLQEFAGVDEIKDHDLYYGAVVKKLGLDDIMKFIPFSIGTLAQSYSKDRYFNTLLTPIKQWDQIINYPNTNMNPFASPFGAFLASNGITAISFAECICILKQAAKLKILQNKGEQKGEEKWQSLKDVQGKALTNMTTSSSP